MNEYELVPEEQVEEQEVISQAVETIFIKEFTDGVLDPQQSFLGPLRNGGTIIANIAPGGWGPMVTPAIRGSQEVTVPVYIEGAEVGDTIAIEVRSIDVTSQAAVGGTAELHVDRFISDPLLKVKCPGCGKLHPRTYIDSVGKDAIKCATCHTQTTPLHLEHGYTAVFHERANIAVTIGKEGARKIAQQPNEYMHLPEQSIQNPATVLGASDLAGVIARVRPFIGEIGTIPSKAMPASYNAKDAERKLLEAPHEFTLTKDDLSEHCTDGHLQMNVLREGSIILCPVKVQGAGLYMGDIRMMQGAASIARQTASVAGLVQLRVHVLKKLEIGGPIILPNEEDLLHLARPFSKEERKFARDLAEEYGVKQLEEVYPVSFVGTGATINEAIDTAVARAATLLDLTPDEVKNRATIAGDIQIARLPGAVLLTAQFPKSVLKRVGIYKFVKKQYD